MPLRRLFPASAVVLVFLAVACASGGDPGADDGDDGGVTSEGGTTGDATTHDSSPAGDDASTADTSSSVDSGSGGETGTVESGMESGADTGADTGSVETGADSAADTGTDGTADTGVDTGAADAPVDTGTDSPIGNPNCATTCAGCCDVNNVCYTTHTDTECPENNAPGMTGQACVDCTTMGPAFHCILDIIVYACFP
jgi:hypothetical protein